ncbi:MAG: hypothetical protein A2V70_20510 [Planctomycetes bacterium RBG_13_63_9]|nr:MAG: hypothetical protein A2V70_20510 [Planctomycetes bacterium RBG_13_63_9]
MNTSATEIQDARAQDVRVSADNLVVELADGRTLTVPLAWFPRLWYGNEQERARFEILGDGRYLHWPDLDEDLTIAGMLAGRGSGESADSLKRWLAGREGKAAGADG